MASNPRPPFSRVVYNRLLLGILILSLLGFGAACLLPGWTPGLRPAGADATVAAAVRTLAAQSTADAAAGGGDPGLPGWILTSIPGAAGTLRPPTAVPLPSATPTLVTPGPTPLSGEYTADLVARIDPPWGAQGAPYVILSGFSLRPGKTVVLIRGMLGDRQFDCPGSRCELPVTADSLIAFRVFANNGDFSSELKATIRISRDAQGYYVAVEQLSLPAVPFTDACSAVWDLDPANAPQWAKFPESPDRLHTDKTLHYLAGQMIFTGAVDAALCPGGGMGREGPNGCGLALAETAMIEWQNRYDQAFWLGGREQGIPPILLKTLVEVESQFWPKSERYFVQEYGLSQINEYGADTALRWDIDLYKEVCAQVFNNCSRSYARRSPNERAMLRGYLISQLDADCWSCQGGIDVEKSNDSIPLIARVVRSNCIEADYILDTYNVTASYQDYWKFTLLNYHSGYGCLRDAIAATVGARLPLTWENVYPRLACPDSKEYVERVWTALGAFEGSTIKPGRLPGPVSTPMFAASATPVPSATPYQSRAQVYVRVYLDLNGDGQPQDDEWLNNITVQMNLSNGILMDAKTVNGQAMFEVTGFMPGLTGVVYLPGLYRYQAVDLPLQGSLTVDFPFSQPLLPTALP
ncbi:MAG: hypothetical protein ACKOC5_10505 [Chloroflexota bacterium]